MSSQFSLPYWPPDAPSLVALRADGDAEIPEYCFSASSPKVAYIPGFANPRGCTVLIVPSYLHGVSCLLLLLRDSKASSVLSAALQSELVHGVAGLCSRWRRLLCGGRRVGSTASLRVR